MNDQPKYYIDYIKQKSNLELSTMHLSKHGHSSQIEIHGEISELTDIALLIIPALNSEAEHEGVESWAKNK